MSAEGKKSSEKASEDTHDEMVESTKKGSVSEMSADEKGDQDSCCQQNISVKVCNDVRVVTVVFHQSLLLFTQLTAF